MRASAGGALRASTSWNDTPWPIGGNRVGEGADGEDEGQDGAAHGGGSEAAASVQRASL